MKQLNITFLLVVLMSITTSKASAHDIEVQNADGVTIYYNLINNDTKLAVTYQGTSYNSSVYTGNVVIPNAVTYNGKKFTVTSIGDYAFYGCTGLTSVTIPNSVTSIGSVAFSGCHLTSMTIPNSVTSIGSSAFYNCFGLTSVQIPNSVKSIGYRAFSGCSALTSVTIPNSVKNIVEYTFSGCSGLTSVTIGNSVTSIGRYAFAYCSGLTSVTIGNSVTSIGNDAFWGCTGLASVVIPNSLTSIGNDAFTDCSSLTKVIVKDIAAWCKISFGNNQANPLYYAHHLYSDENTEITYLVIPNSVTYIGHDAFYYCSGLTSVEISNSVTSIGDRAFQDCFGLTSVEIPNSVTSIGMRAFQDCSGLTSVEIPNCMTSIGTDAFNFVNEKEMVNIYSYILEPTAKTGSSFSAGIYNNAKLHIPEGTLEKYKATGGWKKFVWIEEDISSGFKSIENETLIIDDTTNEWYTLDGRRLNGKPTQKGIYIVNGRKIVVK